MSKNLFEVTLMLTLNVRLSPGKFYFLIVISCYRLCEVDIRDFNEQKFS